MRLQIRNPRLLFSSDLVRGHKEIKSHTQSPVGVLSDHRARVYFCSRGDPDPSGQFVSRVYFADFTPDFDELLGVSVRSVCELGLVGAFDEFGQNPVDLLPVENRLFLYYAGWSRPLSVPFIASIGLMESIDGGQTFKRLGSGPVLGRSITDPLLLGSPRVTQIAGKWMMHYSSGVRWISSIARPEPVYKIRSATSVDGINWKPSGSNILTEVLGRDECQASAEVFEIEGKFAMLFSFRDAINYKSGEGQYQIGFAISDDLETWFRRDEDLVWEGERPPWMAKSVSYPSVIQVGKKLHLLFQGNGIGEEGFGVAEICVIP